MTTIAAASATATTTSSTMKQWSTSRTFQKHCWKRGIEIVAKKTTSDLKLSRPSILRVTLIVSANHHTPLPRLLTPTSISFINNKNECFAAEGFLEKKHREASFGHQECNLLNSHSWPTQINVAMDPKQQCPKVFNRKDVAVCIFCSNFLDGTIRRPLTHEMRRVD